MKFIIGWPSLSSLSRSSTKSIWLIISTRCLDSVTPQKTMSFPISSDQLDAVCNQFPSLISKCVLSSSSKSYLKKGIRINLSFPPLNS